jgi:hypothetical protein
MIFTRINRANPERIFLVVYNSHGTSDMANGYAVAWDYVTDADGVSVMKPAADNDGFGMAGVAPGTITKTDYGLLQVWGFHTAARVKTMTSTSGVYFEALTEVAKGVGLAGNLEAVWCLMGIGTGATSGMLIKHCGFALAAQAEVTSAAIDVFVQAL